LIVFNEQDLQSLKNQANFIDKEDIIKRIRKNKFIKKQIVSTTFQPFVVALNTIELNCESVNQPYLLEHGYFERDIVELHPVGDRHDSLSHSIEDLKAIKS
jgi:hypothetical protein